ncbi:hypothetical protein, partial [Limosilactobacillus fermentum]|uniref:hypothetical protein n=1 Tax=Limosilactobacillus fermentum TaxID=1613 RepID=UPI0035566487
RIFQHKARVRNKKRLDRGTIPQPSRINQIYSISTVDLTGHSASFLLGSFLRTASTPNLSLAHGLANGWIALLIT